MRRLALLGVVFYAINQGAVFVAVDGLTVATTSLVLSLTPLLVTVRLGTRARRAAFEQAVHRRAAGTDRVVGLPER